MKPFTRSLIAASALALAAALPASAKTFVYCSEASPEGVTVSTASGDVSVTLPQPTGGDGYLVTTQTASGDVDAIASDGRRPVTVTTASGDISVQY